MTKTRPPRWRGQWKELVEQVIDQGNCTGCAGCVIACPHDVIGYAHEPGQYKPFHLEDELGPKNCGHGEKGCTSCTRACPRFGNWEQEANTHLFARDREAHEMFGIHEELLLVRSSDDDIYDQGQDGGLVSTILIWCLENDIIDAALVSHLESEGTSEWKAKPGVATNRQEVLAASGSRYTYSCNTLAYDQAKEQGHERLALVGTSCQTSIAPVMWHRKIGKVSKPFKLNIGLLCSKSFDDSMFDELFFIKYGLDKNDIAKMNIKGVFQIWMKDGTYHEISLKECHAWTRTGCNQCPDFAAQHADISTGGIGNETDWTLTVVRTELGAAVINAMKADGVIQTRPGSDDQAAIDLMQRLATNSRKRWPDTSNAAVKVGIGSKAPARS